MQRHFRRFAMRSLTTGSPDGFWPPWCPNSVCRQSSSSDRSGFFRHGYYSSHARHHRIPRFLCRSCRTTMSSQTFDRTYRLRRPELDDAIEREVARGTSLRGVARTLGINRKTVTRRLRRSGVLRPGQGLPALAAREIEAGRATQGQRLSPAAVRRAGAVQAGRASEVSISRIRS